MKFTECQKHETSLRQTYISSSPRARWSVISQRLQNPDGGPNLLVLRVSAVEALARSVALHSIYPLSKVEGYELLKRERGKALLEKIAKAKFEKDACAVFGDADIETLVCAEKYRDLLIHECTYLQQGYSSELIDACDRILNRLLTLQ